MQEIFFLSYLMILRIFFTETFCHHIVTTHIHHPRFYLVYLKTKRRLFSPPAPHPWPTLLWGKQEEGGRGRNRGSSIATGSTFQLQEPSPSSCCSFSSYHMVLGNSESLVPISSYQLCALGPALLTRTVTCQSPITELALQNGGVEFGHCWIR